MKMEPIVSSETSAIRKATSPLQTQPGIYTTHNPATDILHWPAYEDGTDSEFRNVGN